MTTGTTLKVLACFFDTDTLSFSEICKRTGYAADLGGYYIRQLIAEQRITRTSRGTYSITALGKQQLISLTPKKPRTVLTTPRFCVLVIPQIDDKLVIMRRKRQPYIGYAEWPAGRVLLGEDITERAKHVVEDRIGTSGTMQFIGFYRRIDVMDDVVFDDKLFAVHTCMLVPGTPIKSESEYGYNSIIDPSEIATLERVHGALPDILAFSQHPQTYCEKHYTVPSAS